MHNNVSNASGYAIINIHLDHASNACEFSSRTMRAMRASYAGIDIR